MRRRHLLHSAGAGALAALSPAGWAQVPAAAPYQWRHVPFGGGGYVSGLLFHPREPGLLYARTDVGGAYRFDPQGQRWLPLMDHLSKADGELMGVLALAVDPQAPDRLYAACGTYTGEWARKAALLASNDRGRSWTQHELPFKLGGNEDGRGSGERLAVDPHRPQVLYLGSTRDGLWRSEDRGARFQRVSGFPGRHVSLVVVAPRPEGGGPPPVWVGCHDQPGLYVSYDGGERFERDTWLPAMAPQRAAFDAQGHLVVTLAAGEPGQVCNPGHARRGGVWKRAADGRWQDITPLAPGAGPAGFGYAGLDVSQRQPGRLLVSTIERWGPGDEVFLSDNGGQSWTALSQRSRHEHSSHPWLTDYRRGQERMGHWISDVKLDPHDPERVVYGTGYGLWMTSKVGGDSVAWKFAVDNLEETAALCLRSPSGGATLLAAMGDVAGAAWDDLNKAPQAGLFRPNHESNRSVDVAERNPAIMARVSDGGSGGYVSADGGVSWRPFGASPRPAGVQAGHIAVSALGGFMVWAPEKQPALWSRDRGRSWRLCEGWPADRSVALVPVADRHVEGVFYVYDRQQGTVLASSDGGASFKTAIVGLPKVETWQSVQMISAPGALRDLWLALPNGLVRVPPGEKPAEPVKSVQEAWLVALGQGAPGSKLPSLYTWARVLVNGQPVDGLFRSDDGGQTLQRIDDDRHRFGRLLSLAGDPLEHGTVYIAPHGRGVVVGRPRSGP